MAELGDSLLGLCEYLEQTSGRRSLAGDIVSLSLFSDLPLRIQSALLGFGYSEHDYLSGIKTAIKPNATIPTIWVISMRDALLLCNTHRSRGIWKVYRRDDLNCVRRVGAILELIHSDYELATQVISFPKSVTQEDVDDLLQSVWAIFPSWKPHQDH